MAQRSANRPMQKKEKIECAIKSWSIQQGRRRGGGVGGGTARGGEKGVRWICEVNRNAVAADRLLSKNLA